MSASAASAVVFAYHDIGVRGLKVLLDAGVDVRMVVTHADDPREKIWFASVAELAHERHLRCIRSDSVDADALIETCRAIAPDFLFSFYYRHMLKPALLAVARRGAFNMHGSLLPKYRGRAPVNWAILHGESETGATLHVMDAKPDHGAIVDQCAVPILRNDTAREVFDKVTTAAEIVLHRSLPSLIDGTARLRPQDLVRGSYFGGRTPEDGRLP
ncbi:MAG: formyltransferase, partial [Caldimonas sp.]